MKKILAFIVLPFFVIKAIILMPFIHSYSKSEEVAEFEELHKERAESLANGTWSEEDESNYQEFREDIIKYYGKRCIKHLA